jgi:hypothetical protein
MPARLRHACPAGLFALVALAIAACGGGSGTHTNSVASVVSAGTVTPRPPLPTRPPGSTPDDSIRTMDLRESAPVQALLKDTNGEFVQNDVIYGDLNGDGITDAVVPISSSGTQGTLAFVVLTVVDGKVRTLPMQKGDSSSGGIKVQVSAGKLVDVRAEFGPNDANCCPSRLRTTTYKWDGQQFVIDTSITSANPDASAKPTSSASAQPN